MSCGQVGVMVGRVPQDQHRLLPLHLGQLVNDVEQFLEMGFKHVQGHFLSSCPHPF